MYNLIKVELFKLCKNRSFWTLLIALTILSLAYPLLYYFDHRSSGEPQFTGTEFLLSFLSSNAYVIKFGVAVLAGFFISNEYATGVMKTIASSGNTRGRLYVSKVAVFAIGAMAVALVFPVVSTLEVTLLSGFGKLPEGVGELYLFRILLLTLLYTAAYAAIGALITAILTDSGKTIGFSIIFFLGIDILLMSIGSKVSPVQTLYDYSVFNLINVIDDPIIKGSDWPAILFVPLLTIVVSSMLGIVVFRKKDIK